MPVYEWSCVECPDTVYEAHMTVEEYTNSLIPFCPQHRFLPMGRVYSFSIRRSMPEHFNMSIGKYVSNERQFKDELKRGSEHTYLHTGFEANYQAIDISDPATVGVTEEGLDATRRQLVKAGRKEVQLYL